MLRFKLVSPERIVSDEDALSVSLPTATGEITVLPHHAPLVSLLTSGIIRLRKPSGDEDEIAVSGGFIHVEKNGNVTVLAETAERGHELELSVIAEAKQRAKAVMTKAVMADDVAFAKAAAALEREMARYKLVIKKKHGRTTAPPTNR